eukprot:TRINITY_DN29304_c0_g1_i1.p1 TRINITY_DN29304_c0_g1~~TRINITY_DN29304_c0_g1_i1.p1  ORF type:complete len:399 (+),score=20.14 TRINITY_DN29304_c0_g1_i1:41-1237(+)
MPLSTKRRSSLSGNTRPLIVVALVFAVVWFGTRRLLLSPPVNTPETEVGEPGVLRITNTLHVSNEQLRSAVAAWNSTATVVSSKKLSGGSINTVFQVDLSSGQRVVVKFNNPFWRYCKTENEVGVTRYVASRGLPTAPLLYADTEGADMGLEFLIYGWLPGRLLKSVLADEDTTSELKRSLIRQWVLLLVELRKVPFHQKFLGSFGKFMEPRPLGHNAGCSRMGPFGNYSQYAAARIEMFYPLLPHKWKDMFGSRLDCYLQKVRAYNYTPSPENSNPVSIVHSDASIRNVLVEEDRIEAILDWDFAMAAPVEEELTSWATTDGLDDEGKRMFWEELRRFGVTVPRLKERQERQDHLDVYFAMIHFCHVHLWGLTEKEQQDAMVKTKTQLDGILSRYSC